jgi:SAM-dependent methyltransferase
MTHDEAVSFLASAGPWRGSWADVGAGEGTFTRVLAHLLGRQGAVFAIDHEERAVATLERIASESDRTRARIHALPGDMNDLSAVAGLGSSSLDGILFANVLHFTTKPGAVLAQAAALLRPAGRIVVIEYDRRRANPWVPHPLPFDRLVEVAERAGLAAPAERARRRSEYQGEMYCADVRGST